MAFVGTPARHSRSWLHPLPQSSYLAPPPPQESIPRACPHILSYILYSPQSLIHKGQRDSWFSTWLQDTKKAGRAETEAQVIWLVFDYEEGCGQRGLCSSRPREERKMVFGMNTWSVLSCMGQKLRKGEFTLFYKRNNLCSCRGCQTFRFSVLDSMTHTDQDLNPEVCTPRLFSYSEALGLEWSLPVAFHHEETASTPPHLKCSSVCHLRKQSTELIR